VTRHENGVTIFRVTLPSGEKIVGPIQGAGGHLGVAWQTLGAAARDAESLRIVKVLQAFALRGKPQRRCYEPLPGSIGVRVDPDGPCHPTPLATSVFELAGGAA
jgi:hypothetical protein